MRTLFAFLLCLTAHAQLQDKAVEFEDKAQSIDLTGLKSGIDTNNSASISKTGAAVALKRWGGEHTMTVSLSGTFQAPSVAKADEVTIQKMDGSQSMSIKPVKVGDADGVKIDIVLHSHPGTNVFYMAVAGTEDTDWFYQPPLTEDQQDPRWVTVTETEAFDGAGILMNRRPENVVGSYAVYHKSKRNNKFATGKLCHVFRPKIIDADGKEEWGTLNFSKGVLSVTVTQKFLDDATFPVLVDPTFGYTTPGATSFTSAIPVTWSITAPENGTITKISQSASVLVVDPVLMGAAVYSTTSSAPDAKLAEDSGNASVTGATQTWYDMNLSLAVTGGVVYQLASWVQSAAYRYYDTGGSEYDSYNLASTFETWPNPFSRAGFDASIKGSIYATYTASSSGMPPFPSRRTVIRSR